MANRFGRFLPALAVATVACQDLQQPTASFQVSDGSAFGGRGNPHFYFLPPIVPSPDFSGAFDASLLPFLSLQVSGPFNTDTEATCANPQWVFDQTAGLAVEVSAERYSFGWDTPKSLKRDKVYRVCVVLDLAGLGPVTLGFRDVSPTQGGGSVSEAPVYRFNTGSTLPIKFRVEEGVLNAALCTSGTLGDDYDCTAQFLGSNETALCNNATCALTTGVLNAPELWRIEKFAESNPRCFADDGTSTIPGFPLSMAIPQYAGCVKVTLFDDDLSFDGFVDSFGTVGACFYPQSGPPVKIAQGQDEAIQLHIQYPEAGPTIWALPWGATGGIVDECALIEANGSTATLGGKVAALARRLWRGTQRTLNPWFAPPPVFAFHTGFGGHTSLRSNEPILSSDAGPAGAAGGLESQAELGALVAQATPSEGGIRVFNLAWALPSQMAAAAFCAGPGCSGVSPQPLRVSPGEQVTVTVRVTDNGAVANAGAFGGRSLGTPRRVEGARLSFEDTRGGEALSLTNADGDATYVFIPTIAGAARITAAGFGIGTTGGPYDAFENGTYVNQASLLALGRLTFDVTVCEAGPQVDGRVTADDRYPASPSGWRPIMVNLGGNLTGTAYLHVTNDCDNLYLTFLMPSDDSKDNTLRFVLAQDGDPTNGIAEGASDDILSLSAAGFRDRYLSAGCVGSKQADCGPDDPDRPVNGAGSAGFQMFPGSFLGQANWYVYELKHPLRSGGSPFDVDLESGETVYFYGAVSLGGGSKGNTEFPDQKGNFKNYGQSYTVR